MQENNSSTSNSSRWPAAAFLAAAIIIAFEAFVTVNKESFMAGLEISSRRKAEALTDPSLKEDVVIFGDSRLFSMRPEQVSQALGGLKTANYTWAFLGIDAYDIVLEFYLKSRKQPPRLIIADLPQEMLAAPESKLSLSPGLHERAVRVLPVSWLLVRAAKEGSMRLFWDCIIEIITPDSVKYRDGIRFVVRSYWNGEGWPPRQSGDRRILEGMAKNGSFVLVGPDVVPENFLEQYKKDYSEMGSYENRRVRESFERFIRRAGDAGISILLVNPPQPQSVYDYLNSLGALEKYRAMVEDWEKRYPHFQAPEPLLPVLPDDQFGDAYHVNFGGDLKFQDQYIGMLNAE